MPKRDKLDHAIDAGLRRVDLYEIVKEDILRGRDIRKFTEAVIEHLFKNQVQLTLTKLEASALLHGAISGTVDDAIDQIGFDPTGKAAYQRAERKLVQAIYKDEGDK